MAQGRAVIIISISKWIRTNGLSIKKSLSLQTPVADCRMRATHVSGDNLFHQVQPCDCILADCLRM